MSQTFTIIGISGSLRRGSFNTGLLKAAQELAPEGMKIELLGIGDLPLLNVDHENPLPAIVQTFKDKIKAADAVIFASPEYNFGYSGVLKNAIDWMSRPYGDNSLDDKPVLIMSTAGGMLGGARAQYPLRQVMVEMSAHPMGKPEMIVPFAKEKFDQEGKLTDEKTRKKLGEALVAFGGWIERLR